jgi:hypothetical protein
VSDLEREQARTRAFQAEADKAKAELAAAKPGDAGGEAGGSGFDPDKFRRELLQDVVGVTQLTQAAVTLKEKYPHADPALFGQLDEFGSVDALRVAVEDSHNRVATAITASGADIEAKVRAEYEEKFGKLAGTPSTGASAQQAGDPTVAQLNAMSVQEMNEIEKKDPGVIDRVLRSVS